MYYQEYLTRVKENFTHTKEVIISNYNPTVMYEEFFKWKWFATKLKIFSFVFYSEKVDEQQISHYSSSCLEYAIKNKKGLPIGWQNGIACYSILASENIGQDAVKYATSRPSKHFSAFEIPVIIDLSNKDLLYYKGEVIWGAMYNSFLKNYLISNFGIK